MLVIEIPEATCGTNELLRKYRKPHARAKERDRWHWMVTATAAALRPHIKKPIKCCEIIVTRRARNPMDWDNMGGGLKFLLDALVSNKIILDDKPKVISRLQLQQEVTRKAPALTRVEIVPLLDC